MSARSFAAWLELKVPPPLVALAAGLLMWALAQVAPVIDSARAARAGIAIALLVVGASLDAIALLSFFRARTTFSPLSPRSSTALVRTGLYRFTRNPMYLGLATLLVAWAVYLGSIPALAIVAAFVLYIDRFQVRPEERILSGLFGEEYAAYCRSVRRWI